ncbi:MAG: methyltransferase [Chloroflexaceae bacterium]
MPAPVTLPPELCDLYQRLPETLPAAESVAANATKCNLHTWRVYSYNGWTFDVPPGILVPGGTSRVVHDRLWDNHIVVADRTYAVMGVGLGVEVLIATVRGARTIYALDIHARSVHTTAAYYERFIGQRADCRFIPLVSDLFQQLPEQTQLDVITFNPPAVAVPVSDDPNVIRNVCVGTEIMLRFLGEIAERDLLNPTGELFVTLSNTAELRKIIAYAVLVGFWPEVVHIQTYAPPYQAIQTFLFRMTRPGPTEALAVGNMG